MMKKILITLAAVVVIAFGARALMAQSTFDLKASSSLFSSADKTLLMTNGGHISSVPGSSTQPSPGTGSVTAGSTDNAFTVTGGTSPVTVTFGTAFAAAPSIACNDGTSATAVKVVPSTTTAIVTTTGTDTFSCIAIGH